MICPACRYTTFRLEQCPRCGATMVHWYSVSKEQVVQTLLQARGADVEEVHRALRTVERIPFTWDGFHPGIVIDATVARLRLVDLLDPSEGSGRTTSAQGDDDRGEGAGDPGDGVGAPGLHAPGLDIPALDGPGSEAAGDGPSPVGTDEGDEGGPAAADAEQEAWSERLQQSGLQTFLLTTCFDLLGQEDWLHTGPRRQGRTDPGPEGARDRAVLADARKASLVDLSQGLRHKFAVTRLVSGHGGVNAGTEEGFHRFVEELLDGQSREELRSQWVLEGPQAPRRPDGTDPLLSVVTFLYVLRALSIHPALGTNALMVSAADLRPLQGAEPFLVEERTITHPAGGVTLRWKGSFQVGDREATAVDALRRLVRDGLYRYVGTRARGAALAPRLLQPRL